MSSTNSTVKTKMAPKKTAAAASAPAPVPAPVADVTPPEPKKRRREAAPAAPVAAAPVVADASAAPVAEAPVAPTFESVIAALEAQRAAVVKALHDVKALQKSQAKALKEASAGRSAKKVRDPNAPPRKPSGITKPMQVSDELLKFLSKPAGTLLPRTEVAKLLHQYAKTKGLISAEHKGTINPDAPLRKLLRLTDDQTLTIPNIQKYIGEHFPPSQTKAKKAAAATKA